MYFLFFETLYQETSRFNQFWVEPNIIYGYSYVFVCVFYSLGMNHDGGESSFICPDDTYIMSSTQSEDWKETKNLWSRCSRNYLRQFLK